jgi:hypothetical protein
MRELIERLELMESIPQEKLKRASVRPSGEVGYFDSGASKYGLTPSDMIGWFANKSNEAVGWQIFEPTRMDKKEFGSSVKRVFAGKTQTTSIVKFDLVKGTYAFLDNAAYENGKIAFQKMSPYQRLAIENTPKAFKAFGIV